MSHSSEFHIAVFTGDGIGPEITAPCLEILHAVLARIGGLSLRLTELPAGATCYRDTGTAFPKQSMETAQQADAILLSAMGMPGIRYPDGTEINPQLDLRFDLGLYAGVRPVRAMPGLPSPLADPRAQQMNFVLIRESTEGLFASHDKGKLIDNREAQDTLVITREVSEKLFDFAFELGRKRKAQGLPGKVTCVDKANVFTSFAFFRQIFQERAQHYPDVVAECGYVDATALNMVKSPWNYDVMVTENMFGDILSDLGAGLIGGMGMAPSADIGDQYAVFQPCHGSAPDIVGTGKANPTAMFLSAAMMLDWLGDRHGMPACRRAAALLNTAVDAAFADGRLLPYEIGGNAGTREITERLLQTLQAVDLDTLEFAA